MGNILSLANKTVTDPKRPFQSALVNGGPDGFKEAVFQYLDEKPRIEALKKKTFDYECLVFEGGGVKGCAYGGALRVLSEVGILKQIKRLAGTSAGAFTALQVALGLTLDEMVVENVIPSFYDLYDTNNYFTILYNVLSRYGWQTGNNLRKKIEGLIHKKLGNKKITFKELHEMTGKELCVVCVDLNSRSVVYCHPKTTPYMDVAEAVQTSMALPMLYAPRMVKENNMNLYFVDGGLLENYPVRVYDGWYLSMKSEDSFFNRINENPQSQFEGFNDKTLGMVVFSHGEEQSHKGEFLKRLGPEILKGRPDTLLSQERSYTKDIERKTGPNQMEMDEAARSIVRHLIDKCRHDTEENLDYELSLSEFQAAIREMQTDEAMKNHIITLFGDEHGLAPLAETFAEADTSKDGKLSMIECLDFLRRKGVYLRYTLESRFPKKIRTFHQYIMSMLEVMQTYISESQQKPEDDFRTIGIYTDYVETADFDCDFEDKVYMLKQGYNATIRLLEIMAPDRPNKEASELEDRLAARGGEPSSPKRKSPVVKGKSSVVAKGKSCAGKEKSSPIPIPVIDEPTAIAEVDPPDAAGFDPQEAQGESSPTNGKQSPKDGSAAAGQHSSFGKSDKSPAGGGASSVKYETSPAKSETSPDKVETSPAGVDASPDKGQASPAGVDASPDEGQASPAGVDASPDKGEKSPEKGEQSQVEGKPSPYQGDGEHAAPQDGH